MARRSAAKTQELRISHRIGGRGPCAAKNSVTPRVSPIVREELATWYPSFPSVSLYPAMKHEARSLCPASQALPATRREASHAPMLRTHQVAADG